MIIVTPSFSKSSVFQNVFHAHENAKPAFSNFSGLRAFSKKLRFGDGLQSVPTLFMPAEFNGKV